MARTNTPVAPKLGRCLKASQAAQYLGRSIDEFTGLVRRGLVPYHRDGPRSARRYYERELDAYLESTRVAPRTARGAVPDPSERRGRSIAHLMPAIRKFS